MKKLDFDFDTSGTPRPNPSREDKAKDPDPDTNSLKDQIKERYEQDTEWREILANWVIETNTWWLIAVILILCFSSCIKLSDNVLMVLLGTTTINVLGLAHIVLKGLFQESRSK